MLNRLTLMGVTMTLVLYLGALHGQSATEIYIPVGKSPGISGTATIVGTIDDIDPQHQSMTLSDASGTYKVAITGETKIWLEKSMIKKQNQVGSPSDCKPGLKAEVKYAEDRIAESVTAEWIKVQIAN